MHTDQDAMPKPLLDPRGALWAVLLATAAMLVAAGWGVWRYVQTVPACPVQRPAAPSPNAFDDYVRAANLVAALPGPQGRFSLLRVSIPRGNEKAIVVAGREAHRVFREGARHEFAVPPSMDLQQATSGYLRGFYRLTRVFVAESRLASSRGDPDAAVDALMDALRLGTDARRGGGTQHGFASWAIELAGLQELEGLLPSLDARRCRAAAGRLADLERRRWPFAEALRVEEVACYERLARSVRTGSARRVLQQHRVPPWVPQYWNVRAAAHEVHLLYESARRQAAMPPAQRVPTVQPRHVLARMATNREQLLIYEDLQQARWRLLVLELALRAYHLEHGRPAPALSDLIPRYLAAIPEDPFAAGQPPVYHPGAKPALYSIGPDCVDSGGTVLRWTRVLFRDPGDLAIETGQGAGP